MQPEELAKRFNFVKIGDDGVIEFYCDHSILSSIRACEQYFVESYGRNIRHKDRNWNFDFGSWTHGTLEKFYHHEHLVYMKHLQPDNPAYANADYCTKGDFLAQGMMLWDKLEMEYFKDKHKNFKLLDGQLGAYKLLSDYYEVYGGGRERLQVIGIEVPFGRKKEVPIVDTVPQFDFAETPRMYKWISGPYRAYLTGRFDQLVDDHVSIAPFDHKTTAFFNGSEATKFNPHDGMQGYAYAANRMLQKLDPNKSVSRVVINHICLTDNTNEKIEDTRRRKNVPRQYIPARRFTRSATSYTPEQFEEYRLRQAATFDILYQLLVLERPPQWNTGSCSDMYHKECPFKNVHGLTGSIRDQVMQNQFVQVEQWNPFYESKAEIL